MKNSQLVYSTETGRTCPKCRQPVSRCNCPKRKAGKKPEPFPDDSVVRIRREVKGRGGKTVSCVFGVPLGEMELKSLAKELKQRCGTGGSVKDGIIIIQGDHRETLLSQLQKYGYTVKIAGG